MLRNLVRSTRRTPSIRRTYVVGSASTLRPATAAAAAQTSESYHHDHHDHADDLVSGDGHLKSLPARSTTATPSLHNPSFTILPSPLPLDDVRSSASHHHHPPTAQRSTQSELYPTTGLLDALSLLSICLVKRTTIPRAHDIFRRILTDVSAGRCASPDATVWGSVVEGITSLSQPLISDGADERTVQAAHMEAEVWGKRARDLVSRWEEINGSSAAAAAAGTSRIRAWGLKRGGEKVYQGWLRGLLRAEAPLDVFLPYLHSLPLSDILTAFASTERDILLPRLLEAAHRTGEDALVREIEIVKGQEEERLRRMEEQKVVAEVRPILAKEPYHSKFVENAGVVTPSTEGLPRFAIANLRATLKGLSDGSTAADLPIRRQEALEAASLAAARAELEHAHAQMVAQGLKDVSDAQKLQGGKLQAWMWEWLQAMTRRIEEDLVRLGEKEAQAETRVKKATAGKAEAARSDASSSSSPLTPPPPPADSPIDTSFERASHSPDLVLYLRLLPPDRLALVTILEIMRLGNSGGVSDGMKTARALIAVGKAVETEYRASILQSIMGDSSGEWMRSVAGQDTARSDQGPAIRTAWDRIGKSVGAGGENVHAGLNKLDDFTLEALRKVWTPDWTAAKYLAIGSFLVRALIDTAKVTRYMKDADGVEHTEEQPAFAHAYEYVKGNKLGIIKLNPAVSSRIAKDDMSLVMHPKHLPMLVPPRPWKSYEDGGYLFHRVPVMRFKESAEQTTYLRRASEAGHLDGVFAGLNVLSSTPWAINKRVFDVVLESWNSGQAIADIPAAEGIAQYNKPEKPDPRSADPEARANYVSALRAVTTQMAKDHSERCKFNYNLEIARSFINDVFYIPHNLDFRGRAYPVPPHLNPVGDDLARGLLTFGIKKPLGERGLMWLRIHLANLYGFDKASFRDREQFAIDHEKEIFDSADNPLGGSRWWLSAEDPWQCLACCFEITSALRSPDPTAFLSSLPVHQDGTCNGMQHYAALGGDTQGARAVNLEGGDKPADVYTHIADLVNLIVDKDAAEGKVLAVAAKGKVLRKVVKQTVMTTVYGVTFIGAKDQIAKQLYAKNEIPADLVYHVSGYLAKTVLNCIGDIFSGARAIQDWLTISAKLIARSIPTDRVPMAMEALPPKGGKPQSRLSKELMTSVVWTSPLGLPVVQPYRKPVRKQVMTSLQTVYIADPNAVCEVAPGKQATAMPPNFIHSLDATHMLITAMQCRKDDVTFASVHDSYWSHAASIDKLSENIRESFIELHSRDIIGDLRREFCERYKNHVLPLSIARPILNTKRGVRAANANQSSDADDTIPSDDDIISDDDLAIHESDNEHDTDLVRGKKTPKSHSPKGSFQDANGEEVEVLVYEGKSFVRFVDVLPPCPPKGEFDVNKIRLSPYFFS